MFLPLLRVCRNCATNGSPKHRLRLQHPTKPRPNTKDVKHRPLAMPVLTKRRGSILTGSLLLDQRCRKTDSSLSRMELVHHHLQLRRQSSPNRCHHLLRRNSTLIQVSYSVDQNLLSTHTSVLDGLTEPSVKYPRTMLPGLIRIGGHQPDQQCRHARRLDPNWIPRRSGLSLTLTTLLFDLI